MNFRGFYGFIQTHFWQNRWQASGHERFPGAGRADEQDIVCPSSGDFEGAFDVVLTSHISEVFGVGRLAR